MKRRYLALIILIIMVLSAGSYILVGSGKQAARAAPQIRPLSDAPWSTNVKVNDDLGSERQFTPAIAVDPSGNAYTVWYDYRNGLPDIYFSYRPTGGGWSTNVRVNDDPAGLNWQTSPDISVDGAGNAYALWSDSRDIGGNVYFSYRPAGGNWGANVKVTDASSWWGLDPAIAVNAAGNAYAIWSDSQNSPAGDIYFAYRPAGGSWSSNVKVNDDMGPDDAAQWYPDIAVDGAGNTYAVWKDYRNGEPVISFSYRPAGGSWGPNVQVSDSPIEPADTSSSVAGPSIAVTMAGNAYVVWPVVRNNSGVDETHLRFSFRAAGGSWIVDEQINGTNGADEAAIGVDGNGNIYVIWNGLTSGQGIYFTHRPSGGAWQPTEQVNDVVGWIGYCPAAMAVHSSGKAYAVWYDDRNGDIDIYFSYRPAGGGPVLQLPFNPSHQTGACRNSQNGLNCINSFFDHSYPTYGTNGDITLYSGKVWRDNVNVNNCTLRRNCYDGHDAYDLGLVANTAVLAAAGGYATHHSDPCAGHIVQIDHGNGYATQYLHLKDDTYLLRTPRTVTAGERIGSVGQPASTACGHGYHLHFVALHNGKKVDPYGWAGNYQDPWEAHVDGTRSDCLWTFGCPTKGVLSSTSGGALGSSDGNILVSAPPGAVTDTTLLQLALSPDPVAEPSAVPAWHSFALSTQDLSGNPVVDFSEPLTVEVSYSDTDITYLLENTLRLYSWDDLTSAWLPISTVLDLVNNTATANITHLSLFTLMGQPQNLAPTITSVSPNSGYSHLDTEITISGTDFISTPSVLLGLNELAVTFVDPTTLTAIVPSGLDPGTYDLTVTNPDAQEDTLESAFTVLEPLKVYLPLIFKNY